MIGSDYTSFKEELDEKMESVSPGWLDKMTDFLKGFGEDRLASIKTGFKGGFSAMKDLFDIEASIVVDSNYLFRTVKSCAEKDKAITETFLFRLCENPKVQVFGTFGLEEDVMAMIATGSGGLDPEFREKASSLAEKILPLIEIRDEDWTEDWKRSNGITSEQEKKPYLALSFRSGAHSEDHENGFQKAGVSSVFTFGESKDILFAYRRGLATVTLIGYGAEIIRRFIKVVVAVFKLLADLLVQLITAIRAIMNGTITVLAKVPPFVWVLLVSAGVIIFTLSPEARKKGKEFIVNTSETAGKLLEDLRMFISEAGDFLQSFWDTVKSLGITTAEFFGLLTTEFNLMREEVRKMETAQAIH